MSACGEAQSGGYKWQQQQARRNRVRFSLFLDVNDLDVEEQLSIRLWPRKRGQKECGLVNGVFKMKRGESRLLKFSLGDKCEDVQELLGARPVIWASSGHSGTSCCLKNREGWT